MVAWTIPFVVILFISFDPLNQSLSGIGWRHGGMVWLVLYVVMSGIGMMYSMFLFQRLLGRRNSSLVMMMTLGCVLVVVGVFVPVREHEVGGINTVFHDGLAQLGSGICVLAGLLMMSMLIRKCRSHIKTTLGICVIVAAIMITGLVFLGFAAAAQVLASHLVLASILFMCFVVRNMRVELVEKKDRVVL